MDGSTLVDAGTTRDWDEGNARWCSLRRAARNLCTAARAATLSWIQSSPQFTMGSFGSTDSLCSNHSWHGLPRMEVTQIASGCSINGKNIKRSFPGTNNSIATSFRLNDSERICPESEDAVVEARR